MNSEPTRAVQETTATATAAQAESRPGEAGAAPRPRRSVSPYSVVPALTVIALQFVADEPNPFGAIIDAIGGGHHS